MIMIIYLFCANSEQIHLATALRQSNCPFPLGSFHLLRSITHARLGLEIAERSQRPHNAIQASSRSSIDLPRKRLNHGRWCGLALAAVLRPPGQEQRIWNHKLCLENVRI
jgi:hypothetical protein